MKIVGKRRRCQDCQRPDYARPREKVGPDESTGTDDPRSQKQLCSKTAKSEQPNKDHMHNAHSNIVGDIVSSSEDAMAEIITSGDAVVRQGDASQYSRTTFMGSYEVMSKLFIRSAAWQGQGGRYTLNYSRS